MRLNIKAVAITLGIVWGGAMLFVLTANWLTGGGGGYGESFITVMASVYPGLTAGGGVSSIIVEPSTVRWTAPSAEQSWPGSTTRCSIVPRLLPSTPQVTRNPPLSPRRLLLGGVQVARLQIQQVRDFSNQIGLV